MNRSPSKTTTKRNAKKTFNSWDSQLVTHVNTNQPVCSLSTGERTGSSVLCNLWSNVPFGLYQWYMNVFIFDQARKCSRALQDFVHSLCEPEHHIFNHHVESRYHPSSGSVWTRDQLVIEVGPGTFTEEGQMACNFSLAGMRVISPRF